jgi:hypothetical protein
MTTSHTERQNLTMRMQMRRFTWLTNAFSKKIENHEAAIALHYMHYNFARVHQTLCVTPAMEAGIPITFGRWKKLLVCCLDIRSAAAHLSTLVSISDNYFEIMAHKLPFILFFILIAFGSYRWWFGPRRDGRPSMRPITSFGLIFCIVSVNLWLLTRFEDVLNSFPEPHEMSIFASPWLWISALCVGIMLLLVSFFTRIRHDHAA